MNEDEGTYNEALLREAEAVFMRAQRIEWNKLNLIPQREVFRWPKR